MSGDPWGELSRRYRQDERAQFLFFVEQMAEARQLLLGGALSRQRIGLVAVDNLAEILLHRQKRWIAWLRRHHGDAPIPRLGKELLRELRGDFRARVALAMREAEGTVVTRVLEPILDPLDADIFRTAHAYRGRVYHADHHNEAAVPLIARAYLAAVGRAFVRQQPTGVAGSPDAMSEKICAYGFDLADSWSPGYFAPREAAEAITAKLSDGLGVTLAEAGSVLGSDLVERSNQAEEMIGTLAREGLSRERIEAILSEARAWAEIEADEEVVRLEYEVAALKAARYSDGGFEESSLRREAELMEARNERVQTLRARERKSIATGDIASVGRLGARLTNAKNLGSLFERYRRLDEQMEEIEEVLEDMALGWEERFQEEIDVAEGN